MSEFIGELWVPRPLLEVFSFFSDARNLESLSPSWLNFRILTPTPITMEVGTVIDYRIRFRGIPLPWRSRIINWQPPFQFTDDQVRGPFRHWTHTHQFEEQKGGTLCRDRVDYSVWGGAIVNRLVVRRDVARIFAFRQAALRERFGTTTSPAR